MGPWPVWLSWLDVILQTKKSKVLVITLNLVLQKWQIIWFQMGHICLLPYRVLNTEELLFFVVHLVSDPLVLEI